MKFLENDSGFRNVLWKPIDELVISYSIVITFCIKIENCVIYFHDKFLENNIQSKFQEYIMYKIDIYNLFISQTIIIKITNLLN